MNQLKLFAQATEKGSSEWGAFNAVQGDRLGAFRVQQPKKPDPKPVQRYRAIQPLFKGAH